MSNLNTILYVDPSKNPKQNPLLSISNASTDDTRLTFVAGDKLGVGIVFLSGTDIDTTMATGSIPKYLNLAVGTIGLNAPTAVTTRWYLSGSWGYTGSIDLMGFTSSFASGDKFVEPTMTLQVTGSDGTRQTVMHRKVTVLNPVDII